jgi:hypothetical protein
MKLETAAPRQRLERVVTQCWVEVLQKSEIDPNGNFFDVGGTSLLAVKLYRLLQQRLNVDVSILGLFRDPTVRGFVEALINAQETTHVPRTPALLVTRVPTTTATILTPAERAARQRDAFASRRSGNGRT